MIKCTVIKCTVITSQYFYIIAAERTTELQALRAAADVSPFLTAATMSLLWLGIYRCQHCQSPYQVTATFYLSLAKSVANDNDYCRRQKL